MVNKMNIKSSFQEPVRILKNPWPLGTFRSTVLETQPCDSSSKWTAQHNFFFPIYDFHSSIY